MKYICELCGVEFFSAAENLDGTKCLNCKKGRIKNFELQEINDFLMELEADLMEMEIDLGLEPGTIDGMLLKLEQCEILDCAKCGEDCNHYLAGDPEFMKRHPEMFNLQPDDCSRDPTSLSNEGLMSGLKDIIDKTGDSLRARIFGGIRRKSGEYCRRCVYYDPVHHLEMNFYKSEGNCTVENWKLKNAFDWCEHYSERR